MESYFVQLLKPTVLIGTSGKGGTFTKEVLEEISSYQDVSCVVLFFVLYVQPSSSTLKPGRTHSCILRFVVSGDCFRR